MIRRLSAVLAAIPALAPAPLAASTDAAWAAFRQAVGEACLALAGPAPGITAEVNPFGSESHGVALIAMPDAADGTKGERLACVFDKTTGKAELTAPFDPVE